MLVDWRFFAAPACNRQEMAFDVPAGCDASHEDDYGATKKTAAEKEQSRVRITHERVPFCGRLFPTTNIGAMDSMVRDGCFSASCKFAPDRRRKQKEPPRRRNYQTPTAAARIDSRFTWERSSSRLPPQPRQFRLFPVFATPSTSPGSRELPLEFARRASATSASLFV